MTDATLEEIEAYKAELMRKIEARMETIKKDGGWNMTTIRCLTVHDSYNARIDELERLKLFLLKGKESEK